jgi:hypothetical protein
VDKSNPKWFQKGKRRIEVNPEDSTGEPNQDVLNYAHMEVKQSRWAGMGDIVRSILGWVIAFAVCFGIAFGVAIMNRGWDGFLTVLGWK